MLYFTAYSLSLPYMFLSTIATFAGYEIWLSHVLLARRWLITESCYSEASRVSRRCVLAVPHLCKARGLCLPGLQLFFNAILRPKLGSHTSRLTYAGLTMTFEIKRGPTKRH